MLVMDILYIHEILKGVSTLDWMEEVTVHSYFCEEYHQALEDLRKLEPDFAALREGMTETQRELLDRYIAACEALDDVLTHLAYRVGEENDTEKPERLM